VVVRSAKRDVVLFSRKSAKVSRAHYFFLDFYFIKTAFHSLRYCSDRIGSERSSGFRLTRIGTAFLYSFSVDMLPIDSILLRYKVSNKLIIENYGRPLLKLYDFSPFKILSSVYPERGYLPWLFKRVDFGFFRIPDNRRKYVMWLMDKVGVKDVLKLHWLHFKANGGYGLLNTYQGSVLRVISSLTEANDVSEEAKFGSREMIFQRDKKPHKYWVHISFLSAFCNWIT
jgi:hypothetical protein